jgi:hypothetical protein
MRSGGQEKGYHRGGAEDAEKAQRDCFDGIGADGNLPISDLKEAE